VRDPADDEPIEELLERLRPRFKSILASYSIPYDDAEDMVQEILISTLRQWNAIRDREAWVMTALRNRCALYWKRCWSRRMQGMDMEDLEALCEPLPPPQEQEQRWWDVEAAAAGLEARHWALLCLRFGGGLTTAELAERLGYCPTSIRKLVIRSLGRLRRSITAPPSLLPREE
jgi:RNA polymerase sigma factor (sigma-70 family)